MKPWPHHQHVEDAGILPLEVLIDAQRSEQIFIVVPAADRHHRGVDVLQIRKDVAFFPKLIVVRMLHHLVPELDAHAQFLRIEIA